MKPKQNISRYLGYFCAKFNSNRFSRLCVFEPQKTKEGDGRWLLWTHDEGGREGTRPRGKSGRNWHAKNEGGYVYYSH